MSNKGGYLGGSGIEALQVPRSSKKDQTLGRGRRKGLLKLWTEEFDENQKGKNGKTVRGLKDE